LLDWIECPEIFFLNQQGLSEQESLKTASEMLYLALLDKSPDLICRQLCLILQDLPSQQNLLLPSMIENPIEERVLYWNSVYLCTGLSVSSLSGYMDPMQWLLTVIGPLLTDLIRLSAGSKSPQMISTRLFWLLSCWIYQFDFSIVPQLIILILQVIDPVNRYDIVCVLTSIETLQSVLKSDHFLATTHAPCLEPLLISLCDVATHRFEENETKATAVKAIGDVISLMTSSSLEPYIPSLSTSFGNLWGKFGGNSPLLSAVIEV
jgi:hypothetical protein